MRLIRFEQGGKVRLGILGDDGSIRVVEGDMFEGFRETDTVAPLSDVHLLPPTSAAGMIALWNNSRPQIEKLKRDTPKEVLWFMKPAASFATHGDDIVYPTGQTERVVLEGEIGVVIGKRCRNVTPADAAKYILGYTVVNDVTAQDIVKRDPTFPQYSRAKGFESFSIFGPCVATGVDPMTLRIESFVNGRKCQDYAVTDLVFGPYDVVAQLSRTMDLVPGDVIALGTSLGADPISPGDTVEIRIEGIGSLINSVRAAA